jgi:hypothetical protein
MSVNRRYPTEANPPATNDGATVAAAIAEEGEAAWRVACEPLDNVGGTANAITADPSVSSLAAYQAGNKWSLIPQADNTGSTVTLAIGGLAARPVKTASGANPVVGAIKAGRLHLFEDDGTNLRVISPDLDAIDGPVVAAESQPTSDVTEVVWTGLSIYRDLELWFIGRVSAAATVSVQARESGGTWRTIASRVVAAADDIGGRVTVRNWNRQTEPKLIERWLSDDIGTLLRVTEGQDGIAFSSVLSGLWQSYQESYAELKVVTSAGALIGTTAEKRFYGRVMGQR